MEIHRLCRVVARLFAVAVVLSETVCAVGACRAPHYRRGQVPVDNASEISLYISIRPDDFAPGRLACLGEALRQKYPDRNVVAFMFSSHEAAREYRPVSVDSVEYNPTLLRYQSKFLGDYFYNKQENESYVSVWSGWFWTGHSHSVTRIDLPSTGSPGCRLAIKGRCLLEFGHMEYPSIEGQTEISGEVTFAGSIRRNGALANLTAVASEAIPSGRESALIEWAKQDLSSWRFERSKTEGRMRITYHFEPTDDPSLRSYRTVVQFRLPDEVRILTSRRPLP